MAVRIRKSNKKLCKSCKSNGGKFYDVGIGFHVGEEPEIITLCDTCMHELLQKIIVVGKEQ